MKKQYKNLVFDLGGVLWQLDYDHLLENIRYYNSLITRETLLEFMHRNISRFGKSLITEKRFTSLYRSLLKNRNLTQAEIESLHDSFLHKGPTAVVKLLPRLKSRYVLILLSNTDRWHLDYILNMYPVFEELFHTVVYSFEAKALKPDEKIFFYMRQKANIDFSESLFFDDLSINVESARSLCLDAVLVEDPLDLYGILEKEFLK